MPPLLSPRMLPRMLSGNVPLSEPLLDASSGNFLLVPLHLGEEATLPDRPPLPKSALSFVGCSLE